MQGTSVHISEMRVGEGPVFLSVKEKKSGDFLPLSKGGEGDGCEPEGAGAVSGNIHPPD